jgi:hypothetical protein
VLLIDSIASLLAEQAPFAATRIVSTPPVVGAGLLGLDQIAAPAQSRTRLRARYVGAA